MAKKIIWIFILVIVVAGMLLTFSIGKIIKNNAEKYLPSILGVPVKVEKVSVSLWHGTVSLHGLLLGAPSGYKIPYTFKTNTIAAKMDLSSLFGKVIHVKDVHIDSPSLSYAMMLASGGMQNNLSYMMSSAKKSGGDSGTSQTNKTQRSGSAAADEKPKRKVIIDHLIMTNIHMSYSALGQSGSATLPSVELHNIGGVSHGVTIAQALRQILTAVLEKVHQKSIAKGLTKSGGAKAKQSISKGWDKLKEKFK